MMANKLSNDQSNSEHGALGIGLSRQCSEDIDRTRNNDPTLTKFVLLAEDAGRFSDKGWDLLGRYITNKTHLTKLDFSHLDLGAHADRAMSLLFNNLTGSSSLKELYLSSNEFGLSTVQSTVNFLKSCTKLNLLSLSGNRNINTGCFQVILEALDGSSVEDLRFGACSITDITALAKFNLPHLKEIYLSRNNINSVSPLESCTSLEILWLGHNEIGNEGCEELAKLLANKSSSLRELYLCHNNINDEGAEIIANSLTHNARLEFLSLSNNEIAERGWGSFLKLLNDVSSIERTYKSNHTLKGICFYYNLPPGSEVVKKNVNSALVMNQHNKGNSHAVGRAKVVATQLNSITRRELCHLQGIEYSYSAIFAGIDPVLLPDLLALVSREHGHNELYCMLAATGPDAFSCTNKEVPATSQKE